MSRTLVDCRKKNIRSIVDRYAVFHLRAKIACLYFVSDALGFLICYSHLGMFYCNVFYNMFSTTVIHLQSI
ncbi:unnamed protein product [Larinioides sclopetarius]|uniref:Uncharacterized protein n=1 Tax=Larinioides sclopetarius TaxID=280406 RepID=A0AAV2AXJ4_9ARAC